MTSVLLIAAIWTAASVALAGLHYVWRARGGQYIPAEVALPADGFVVPGTKPHHHAA